LRKDKQELIQNQPEKSKLFHLWPLISYHLSYFFVF